MSGQRRRWLILVGALLGLPLVAVLGYGIWRVTLPDEGPRIGLSMAGDFVIQRPLYENAIARVGGRSVLITPTSDPARVEAILDDVDALLLTGGGDVDPALYGGDARTAWLVDRHRDEFEIHLIQAAIQRDMPILGICRGIQILNVAHGGTIRDLGEDEALSEHHGIDLDSFTAHDVTVEPGTKLAAVIGAGARRVNSFHGLAVGQVGAGLRVCATADDGVVEGIERPDRTFVIAIQWHPEISSLADEKRLALFAALVHRAEAYQARLKVTSVVGPTTRE
jgi:putative glutamine amidotransferase